jgi:Cu/Zn superoxide dismutase
VSASLRALPLLVVFALVACSGRIDAPSGGDAGSGGAWSGAGARAATGGAGRLSSGGEATSGSAGAPAGASAGGVGGNAGLSGGGSGGVTSLSADAPLQALQGGAVTGTAHFAESGDTIALTITLTGCPAGPHAVHLHANPACADDGNAAGGHWSPQGEGIGDVMCGADGVAQFSFTPPAGTWTIGGPTATDLLPHAVMLHAGAMTDPGARIACGIPAKIP